MLWVYHEGRWVCCGCIMREGGCRGYLVKDGGCVVGVS